MFCCPQSYTERTMLPSEDHLLCCPQSYREDHLSCWPHTERTICRAILRGPSVVCCAQSYMEDHLKNKDRLGEEWEALCAYEAEPNLTTIAVDPANIHKNRYTDILPCELHTDILPCESCTNILPCTDILSCESCTDILPCESRTDILPCESYTDILPCESYTDILSCESCTDILPCESRTDILPCESRTDILPCESYTDILSRSDILPWRGALKYWNNRRLWSTIDRSYHQSSVWLCIENRNFPTQRIVRVTCRQWVWSRSPFLGRPCIVWTCRGRRMMEYIRGRRWCEWWEW